MRQHWRPVASIFGATVALSCLSALFVQPSYIAEGKLRFQVNPLPLSTESDEKSVELRPLVSTQNPLSTEIEVIYAKPLLQNMIDVLGLEDAQGNTLRPKAVLQKLSVDIIAGTDVLKLSYESDQPQESARVVNTLMRLYIHSNIQNQRSRALSARKFIAAQLPQRESVVREAEEALSRFKEKHKIVDLEEEEDATVTAISKLDSEITLVQSEFDAAVARSSTLRNQVGLSPQNAIAVSKLSQSSEIKEILRELQSVERQLVIARKDFQEGFPIVVNLKERRSALQKLFSQKSQKTVQGNSLSAVVRAELDDPEQSMIQDFLSAEVQRQAVSKRLASLKQGRSAYNQRTQTLPKLRRMLRELERKSEAAQSTYETLLQNLQELQVAENTNSSSAQIIEQALTPTEGTTFKKKASVIAFGILLGAFLATAAVPVLGMRQEYLSTSHMTAYEDSINALQGLLDYPIWSVVPHTELKHQTCDRIPGSLISILGEMHRMIRANPQLLSDEHALKSLVVTSLEVQEGKSTVAANLAIAMAQLEQRVLLVDANLQSSKLHHLFDLPNELGLSTAIQDTSIRPAEVKMIIHRVRGNLDILTAGSKPSSPMSFLSSERMNVLLQYFAWDYDFVIFDTSPLLDVDGTSALANMADGVLFVTNPTVTQSKELEMAQEIISQFEHNIIGTVVNNGTTQDYSKVYLPSFKIDLARHKI
ncbi:polysaccharide biosynthesis tyrosine autokinase [Acaryochloris sp. IP29b_bin.148]|uniref:GumC family protein n=1 Tax=Acaryochloris sp. IP29b_bin.148 TaxID=2969218 RepID=UPI002625A511|nr:polysaccharide biosynthesis tyrosine autokinase [Acaryochloris sp. IP29b_bin.148]